MIELTFAVDGKELFINPWVISRFYWVESDKTTHIWLSDGVSVLRVKEKPAKILKLLK